MAQEGFSKGSRTTKDRGVKVKVKFQAEIQFFAYIEKFKESKSFNSFSLSRNVSVFELSTNGIRVKYILNTYHK